MKTFAAILLACLLSACAAPAQTLDEAVALFRQDRGTDADYKEALKNSRINVEGRLDPRPWPRFLPNPRFFLPNLRVFP